MLEPEDLIQDEIEYPDLTWQLQQSYTPSQADQQSLLRVRTRLLEQRSAQMPTKPHEEEPQKGQFRTPSNEQLEQPLAGQFLPSPVAQLPRQQRKPVNSWRLVAWAAVLCIAILSGTLYVLTFLPILQGRYPIQPRVTPTTVPRQKNPILYNIKMISATVGWGRGMSVLDNSAEIARTTDGGKTWQEFDFHGQPAGIIGSFFLDDQTAWVILGSSLDVHANVPLMRTTDGGQHWTALAMPPEMSNITFLDQLHGWAWAVGAIPGVPEVNTFYKTVDGGRTWTELGTLSTDRTIDDPTPGPLPFNDGFDMTFLTPLHGWAIVSPSQDYQRMLLYMTQDGGRTWQLQRLPQPATGPIPGIHTTIQGSRQPSGAFITMRAPKFFTSQHGMLSITSQVSAQKPREIYLYETNNGGQSWSPLDANIESMNELPFSTEILDPTHILLAGMNTFNIYALVDGHWQKQRTSHVAGQATLPSFINALLGWISTSQASGDKIIYTLYATSDGGKSWHEVMHVITDKPQNFQRG